MDYFESGVICTKNRLWKNKKIVKDIVDNLKSLGYDFDELVYGEPNDFIFTDEYEEITKLLSMKGSFFGIRIKMKKKDIQLSVECNTNGVDNVKYNVFAETEGLLSETVNHAKNLKTVIKPSNNAVARVMEYISLHRQVRTMLVIIAVVLGILLVNMFIPIINMAISIFMFAPLLFIYLIYSYRRRR